MLEFALKYPPELFARGALEMQWPWSTYAGVVLVIAIVVAIALGYFGLESSRGNFDRAGLWTIRTAMLAVLLLVLLDPRLVVETDDPVRGHVTVLIDDSLSMRIRDLDGAARSEFVERAFTPGAGSIAVALERRFDTRYLKFSGSVETLAAGEHLSFSGARSDLGQAIESVARAPDAGSLAAIVLVTDGAVDDTGALDNAVRALHASGVTVHAIGVGAERLATDVEVADVRLPRDVLRGDAVEAQVTISHRGLEGQTVTLTVEEESAIVSQQSLTLPANDRPVTLRVPLEFEQAGPRRVVFRIAPQLGEILVDNNAAHRAVDVRGDPVRILHIEGEPRFEVKFLRRAVAADETLRLVSLVRTAENKYYRLGIEDADELAEGLPASEEALFRYDAVVIGSIGNDLLDDAQQARFRDFVARRGGGLVLLGGRRAFAEGGYSGSTLAGIAPVVLPAGASAYQARVPVRPSANNRDHPLLRVAKADAVNAGWEQLPPLTVVNPIRQSKPGATTLLEGDDGSGEALVILAWQRYGRGTVAAFPVRDSWRWQMHADVPLKDQTHEQLWRNLLRHVARPAGSRARLHLEPAEAALGENIAIEAEALDGRYLPLQNAKVTLEVTTPLGEVEKVVLEPRFNRDGFHRSSFLPRDIGRHEFRLRLEDPKGETIETLASVEVSGAGREFYSAELDVPRLSRLAQATGGQFFLAADAEKIVDAIDDTTATVRVEKRLPLRDAPALLIALIALAFLEWAWRRRRGLA
ncbi:MAG: VWA domain-containing protein [Gammaproteobacteria bacterium]|nr:VWA domain-containing protein [Gammaproteobacteria bacterium]